MEIYICIKDNEYNDNYYFGGKYFIESKLERGFLKIYFLCEVGSDEIFPISICNLENYANYMLIDNMVIGEWYYITWISDNLVQFGTKDGKVLRLLCRKKICYGCESMWDYFYTKREVRKQKLDKLRYEDW